MDTIEKIIIIISLFTVFSIVCFRYKRKNEILERLNRAKLCAHAKEYFVTICYKTLTPFGDEENLGDYKTFLICSEYFFVFQKNFNGLKLEANMVMCIRFADTVLIDQWTHKTYSYAGFERYLSNFLGDSFVYDSFIKNQWKEFQK